MSLIDAEKYEKEAEITEEPVVEEELRPSFKTTEQLMWDGFRPQYKRTQEDLNQCQNLMAGAVQLMYERVMGLTDFDISERQYKQFLIDCREETKLYTWGFITLDEVAEWVFDEINVEYEE